MSIPTELIDQIRDIVAHAGGVFDGVQETIGKRFPEVSFFDANRGNTVIKAPFNPEKFSPKNLTNIIRSEFEHASQEKKMSKGSAKETSAAIASTGLLQGTAAPNLRAKLHAVYDAINFVGKGGHNKAQNYDYVKASDVVKAVRKALTDQRVYAEINFEFIGNPYTIARAKDVNAPFSAVNVRATVKFHDLDSDEVLTSSGLGTGADTGDKAAYKAQTGALKYALKNAFLIPDEADPEADERVDEGGDQGQGDPGGDQFIPRNEMPDYQEARRETSRFPPAARAAAPARPAAEPAPSTPESPASTPAASPAPAQGCLRELGDEPENTNLPTEPELAEYREEFRKLGDDLSSKAGGLKASRGLPINKKLVVFLLQVTGQKNAASITVGQWENFFSRVDAAKAKPEVGLQGIAVLVNKANGLEEK